MPAAPVQTASWAHRFLALVVDWAASWLVTLGISSMAGGMTSNDQSILVLAVFFVESALLTASMGGSFGQLVCRLRVTRMDGTNRPPDLLRATLRQALILLVIPPLVFRPDGRGLHDMAADTSTNTLDSLRAA